MGNSDRLDNLLIAWHRAGTYNSRELGYPTECPSCRGTVYSRQWQGTDVDEEGEVFLDTPQAMVSGTGRFVGRIIETLPNNYQLALAYQARALAIGTYAIRNPRLPQDRVRLSLLVVEARGALAVLLGDFLLSDEEDA